MKVSVICPTYDRAAALRRAIHSVLAQEHEDLELLVVCDGSPAETLAVAADAAARDPRVRVIEAERHGSPAVPRQLGVARATGEAIAYVDDDDAWEPDHLARLVAVVGPERPVVVSGAVYRTEDGVVLRRLEGRELTWHPEIGTADPYAEPSRVLHLAGVTDAVGGWRDLGVGLEDWDLWWRLTQHGVPFVPVAHATALLTVAGTSRRAAVRCGFALPILPTPDEDAAAALAHALSEPTRTLHDALHADLDAWGDELREDDRTVWPLDVAGDAEQDWTLALAGTAAGPPELLSARLWGRWHVAIPVWCADPRHARATLRILQRRQPRQLRALKERAVELASAHTNAPSIDGRTR